MISGVFAPTVTVMSENGIDIPATRNHIQVGAAASLLA